MYLKKWFRKDALVEDGVYTRFGRESGVKEGHFSNEEDGFMEGYENAFLNEWNPEETV